MGTKGKKPKGVNQPPLFHDESHFESIFREYYRSLTYFSLGYVKNLDTGRELVQEVFVNVWANRQKITIHSSIKSYLYSSVRNACINYLKSRRIEKASLEEVSGLAEKDDLFDHIVEAETRENLYSEIEKLPKRCKQIFTMSRFEGLRHAEIAKRLDLSVKSVENQISIALKRLAKFKALLGIFLLWLSG